MDDSIQINGLLEPVDFSPKLAKPLEGIDFEFWVKFFIAFGLVIRSLRYFLRFPLWEDESFLGVSLFKRNFGQLCSPLDYHQVAPAFFLFLEKTVISIFGFNEMSLRLPAYVCGIASLFLVYHLSNRLLKGPTKLLFVALFAVSYPAIRYSAEAKPYGTDMFASLLMLIFVVEWLRNPRRFGWVLALILWTPIAIGLSFPAIFTAGGMSLLLFLALYRKKNIPRGWIYWLVFNAVTALSFLFFFKFFINKQLGAEIGYMSDSWSDTFPSLRNPLLLLKWLVVIHTGDFFAHPVGGENFGSSVTLIFWIVGTVVLIKRRKFVIAGLMLTPMLLNFGAAALQKYPYGGHVKFSMFIAPMLCLVMAVGIAAVLNNHAGRASIKNTGTVMVVILSIISAIGLGTIVRDALTPCKTLSDMRARAFARWFWYSANFDGRAVCIKDDLGYEFSKNTWSQLSWSAMYLCNKYIYDRPDDIFRTPRPGSVPQIDKKVLSCVLYRDPKKLDFDEQAFGKWLSDMKTKYKFISHEQYPVPRNDKKERKLINLNYIDIYRFEVEDFNAIEAMKFKEASSKSD